MKARIEMKKYKYQEERPTINNGDILFLQDKSNTKSQQRNIEKRRRRSSGGALLQAMNKQSLAREQKNLEFRPTDFLEHGSRKLVMEGLVQIYKGSKIKERCLFLYNDLIVIAKEKSRDKFNLKESVKLSDMWMDLMSVPQFLPSQPCFHHLSFVLGWPASESLVAIFSNRNIRDIWYQVLQNHISVARDREKTSLPIKIALQGSSYSVTKSLMVTNRETAHDLLERCITEFRLQMRSSSDFQLHISEAEENSRLLHGFENPFSIYTNLLRSTKCDSLTNFLPEIKLLLKARGESKLSNDKNTAKNKLTLLKRMLSRGNSTGRLFGRELSELLDQNEFCPTLMTILGEIYVNGPICIGIFRKSASQAVKTLRSQLDSGDETALSDVYIHDMAALLKEFLRSMPDCLLTSSLYTEWLKTATILNKELFINQIKRLVNILPRSHLLFLKYLLCVLTSVAQVSDQNLMTPYNLAVCISQCILWSEKQATPSSMPNISAIASLPSCSSLEQYNDITKINLLVQRLIENAAEIVGHEWLMLFNHLSERRNFVLASFTNTNRRSSDSDSSLPAIEENTSPSHGFLKSGAPKLKMLHSKKGMYASTPLLPLSDT